MKTYTISVEQHHIDAGVPEDVVRCPIGLALQDAGGAGIYFPYDSLPDVAQRFIRDFDDGKQVKPFTFIMDDYRY